MLGKGADIEGRCGFNVCFLQRKLSLRSVLGMCLQGLGPARGWLPSILFSVLSFVMAAMYAALFSITPRR